MELVLNNSSNVGKTFDFKINGNGIVTHEARVDYENWSSVLQILKFTDENNKDRIALRLGYCDQTGKLIARPLYLTECELADLGKAAAKEPEIKKMLKTFCDQIR
jgi:hypothetical protein